MSKALYCMNEHCMNANWPTVCCRWSINISIYLYLSIITRQSGFFTSLVDRIRNCYPSSLVVFTGYFAKWTLFTTRELGNTIFTTSNERSITHRVLMLHILIIYPYQALFMCLLTTYVCINIYHLGYCNILSSITYDKMDILPTCVATNSWC